jgi:hypothetical protein
MLLTYNAKVRPSKFMTIRLSGSVNLESAGFSMIEIDMPFQNAANINRKTMQCTEK